MKTALMIRILAALAAFAATPALAAGTACESLIALTIPKVRITSAAQVAAGSFAAPGVQTPFDVPAFCRVQGIASPTSDSEIRFEVWIPPAAAWNGKFQGVGNGGYQGSISYPAMAAALNGGYAVASTDTGHAGGNLEFGQGRPEKVIDWAYRAIHVTAETGKLIVRNHMGRWPEYSYFVGCSTGGHQALSEAQRFPGDYDGIVVGDPGYDRVRQTAAYLWSWMALHDEDGAPLLTQPELKLITRSAVAACDRDDGVADGVIDDPRRCGFDPATLLCEGAKTDSCLTAQQIAGVQKVYDGLRHPRTGEQLFPGWSKGSEGFGESPGEGWGGFLISPKVPMRSEVYNYFLFHNPNWDFRTMDFDRDIAYADAKIGFMAAIDPDLGAFRDRGGKMIMYTGWADPVAAPEDVLKYHEEVADTMGGYAAVGDFFRFFMAPGMGHCGGGYGPNTFEMLPVLEQWVESGVVPQHVTASFASGDIRRTRPLCPYPQVARWTGAGSTDDAANFACSTLD